MAISALAMSALLLVLVLVIVSASRASASGPPIKFEYLIFPEGCLPKFLSGDLFDAFCVKRTISKVLGYGIITGACVVKLPQILRFVAAGSVKGISRWSTYLELLGYLMGSIYHISLGNPWSAYGETVIVTIQSALICIMVWVYDPPSVAHITAVTAVMAVAVQQTYSASPEKLAYVQLITIVLFVMSRAWQVVTNFRQHSTGELAVLTLFMNFAGSAARIFTSSQEVKQVMVMASFVISTILNGTLFAQYIYFNFIAPKPVTAKSAPVATSAGKRPAKAVPAAVEKHSEEPAAAAADGNEATSEADAPGSGGGARRRKTRRDL